MIAEILSPAGSFEQLEAAVKGGADAVYLALKKFGARAAAQNFDENELKAAVEYCHKRGVLVYVAVNTVVLDSELDMLTRTLQLLCEEGVDGVISQDLAVVRMVRELCPTLPLHASTQMTLHTSYGLAIAKRLGFRRVVLSRELDREGIRKLAGGEMQTEAFVHGAHCMSVSGQCFMSAFIGGRSANRGACAQPCRLPFSADSSEHYALSLKDMSLLHHLTELESYGVNSFKIEGRMKRPEYAALATSCAKNALDGDFHDDRLLSDVFSRGGFTDGYYQGTRNRDMFGRRTEEDAKKSASAIPQIHERFRREYKRGIISYSVTIKKCKPLVIRAKDELGLTAEYVGRNAEPAINRPVGRELLERQLSKLGDTYYKMDSLECDIDPNLSVSAAELNEARRSIVTQLEQKRLCHFTSHYDFSRKDVIKPSDIHRRMGKKKIRLSLTNAEQLTKLNEGDFELAFLPLDIGEIRQALELFSRDKIGVEMPRFTYGEPGDISLLNDIVELGISHVLCTNLAHVQMCSELNLTAHTGFGLNITNSLALDELRKLGVSDAVVSVELKAAQIRSLSASLPIGVMAYGRLPLMLCCNCPIKAQLGCKSCTGTLSDRTSRDFDVKCSKSHGYVEILNSDTLSISDKQSDFESVDFFEMSFYNENADRVKEIVRSFENGKRLDEKNITRGLYYRGLRGSIDETKN